MCSFRGVLELCCFLADERSCGENSDTESTTVGQFVCIFYGHTQSLPEMTFWWTRKSHKFQVDIPALGAKIYFVQLLKSHFFFPVHKGHCLQLQNHRPERNIKTTNQTYPPKRAGNNIFEEPRKQFYSLHSRPVLLVVTDLESKWLIFEVSAAFTRSFVFDREKR